MSAISALTIAIGGNAQGASDRHSVIGELITVQYVSPQHFTDFSIHNRDIRYSATVFTQEVTEELTPIMNKWFLGRTLTLRFINIDLAGEGTARSRSVRVVRTNRPARLSFVYLLQDQSGRSVASGSQTLSDTPRLGHASHAVNSGPVPLERRMLQTWLRHLSVAL